MKSSLFACLILLTPLTAFAQAPVEPALAAPAPPIPQWQRTPGKLEAKVAPYKGRMVLMVNGQPVAPQMYSGTEHSRETWTGLARQSIQDFSAIGYDIIQTDLWLKYSLRPDGTFDMGGIRRQLAGILEINPKAKLLVRINVSAPKWWLEQNPPEICKVTAGMEKKEYGGNSAESLASEKYAAFAHKYLKQFIAELEKTDEGDRVIGFHLGGGVYGEWHYYGIFNEPDASEPMRQKFVSFALSRHGSLARINEVWHTDFSSLDQLVVPSFERRYEVSDGDFRDPKRDRYVMDYYECQQSTLSTLVNDLAKTVKETWSRPTLVGLFYGYLYGGFTVGAQASQLDVQTLFRSSFVDYFSGPYASRSMDGTGIPRSLVQSVSLNGKIWMTEHDGGSHLGNISNSKFPNVPLDEAQSIARMRRNFMHGLTDGAGQWWYDFGPRQTSGGWSTPAMLAEAKSLLGLAKASLERPYEKPSDVLVVYDMPAFYHVLPARVDALTKKITESMTDSLLSTGAAVDRVFLMDLPQVELTQYKLVIFGNTFVLNGAQRALIRERVMTPGRTVVFMSGCGYSDGNMNSTALISELVGIKIEKVVEGDARPTVRIGDQTAELDDSRLLSRFRIADGDGDSLGSYPSGSTAAAAKELGGCRLVYFGVPLKAPLPLFQALLREGHIRTFVENTVEKDCVTVGGGLICIYSVSGGERVIKPMSGAKITVSMPPYSTMYFNLQTGAALNALPASDRE